MAEWRSQQVAPVCFSTGASVPTLLPCLGSVRHPIAVSYAYRMDAPAIRKRPQTYAMGVSELCVLPDGQLLVLEREVYVPKSKIGASCQWALSRQSCRGTGLPMSAFVCQ